MIWFLRCDRIDRIFFRVFHARKTRRHRHKMSKSALSAVLSPTQNVLNFFNGISIFKGLQRSAECGLLAYMQLFKRNDELFHSISPWKILSGVIRVISGPSLGTPGSFLLLITDVPRRKLYHRLAAWLQESFCMWLHVWNWVQGESLQWKH